MQFPKGFYDGDLNPESKPTKYIFENQEPRLLAFINCDWNMDQ